MPQIASNFILRSKLPNFEITESNMVKKMGNISDLVGMMPGLNRGKMKINPDDIDESKIERTKAIILSMTKKERENPAILNSSRKQRIASGSGTSVQDVNRLLKQFEQSKVMMKQMKNNRMFKFFG